MCYLQFTLIFIPTQLIPSALFIFIVFILGDASNYYLRVIKHESIVARHYENVRSVEMALRYFPWKIVDAECSKAEKISKHFASA